MLKSSALVKMKIFHERHGPKRYKFTHKMLYIFLKVGSLLSSIKTSFFSVDQFNFFSVFWKDYGFREFSDPKGYVLEVLKEHLIDSSCVSDIYLLTIPKALGWGFNPVSFWLCFDADRELRIVLTEVNNTFNERHGYLCFNPGIKPIRCTDVISQPKVFHVSPFCQVKGRYNFRFDVGPENINIDIDYFVEDKKLISTAIRGEVVRLNSRNLLANFISLPFMSIKVLFFIHFHALRLWLKKIPFNRKPKKININIT